jgi:hypothetical protein
VAIPEFREGDRVRVIAIDFPGEPTGTIDTHHPERTDLPYRVRFDLEGMRMYAFEPWELELIDDEGAADD